MSNRCVDLRRILRRSRRLWKSATGMVFSTDRDTDSPFERRFRSTVDSLPHRPFVLQIGAHDGETNDPVNRILAEYDCLALLVEPQPEQFGKLERKYKGRPSIRLAQCVVGSVCGRVELFRLSGGSLPPWASQVASLKREELLRHANTIPDVEKRITSIFVRSATFDALLSQHDIGTVDVLIIDAEGYDLELLRLFAFQQRKTRLVLYEHTHLTYREQWQALQLLEEHGFAFEQVGRDTIAWQ